jgi:hypothetical protein
MKASNTAWRGALLVVGFAAAAIAHGAASKSEKIDELVGLHELRTAVAIGDCYLKQQTLIAVRDELARMGKAQSLGPDWNPSNPYWKQAEGAMVRSATQQVDREFSNLEWLSEQWAELNDREFSEADIDTLLAHFKTQYGRKQIMLVDHGVAVHVQGALTLSGKMVYEVPGAEEDRDRMQELFNDEDRAMRYNMEDSPEATRFVMSRVGTRYFVNAMLKVSGMINRRLDDTAASIPQKVKALSDQALPALQAFRSQPQG